MEEKTKQTPKNNPVITFRAPTIVEKQLRELAEKWGENITQVMHRCIQIVHEREFKRDKK